MLAYQRNMFDIKAYCNKIQCIKENTQKNGKLINSSENTTQLSTKMRYAQYVRR